MRSNNYSPVGLIYFSGIGGMYSPGHINKRHSLKV